MGAYAPIYGSVCVCYVRSPVLCAGRAGSPWWRRWCSVRGPVARRALGLPEAVSWSSERRQRGRLLRASGCLRGGRASVARAVSWPLGWPAWPRVCSRARANCAACRRGPPARLVSGGQLRGCVARAAVGASLERVQGRVVACRGAARRLGRGCIRRGAARVCLARHVPGAARRGSVFGAERRGIVSARCGSVSGSVRRVVARRRVWVEGAGVRTGECGVARRSLVWRPLLARRGAAGYGVAAVSTQRGAAVLACRLFRRGVSWRGAAQPCVSGRTRGGGGPMWGSTL